MCGIAGASVENLTNIQSSLEGISHRGPDRSNFYQSHGVTLLHTLLSTRGEATDIEQPVKTENNRWIFVFNGEIYNTDDIIDKQPIEQELHNKSDTLVLSHLVNKVGLSFVDYIDGMFAIALFDRQEKKIYLVRDQSGQKNIYYRFHKGDIYFSSELSSILELTKQVPNSLNEEALRYSAHLGYWPGPGTLVAGVDRLLPAQILQFDMLSRKVSYSYLKNFNCMNKDYGDTQFQKIIKSTFNTNCSVGLNLSGGMDSSIILHELSKHFNKINTYTTLYSDCDSAANTEADLARRLSKDYGTHHFEFEISQDHYIDNFIDAYCALDEPNFNMSVPIYFLLAKFQGINGNKERVIFSGDGGDEVFCGYKHYEKSHKIDVYAKVLSYKLFSILYACKHRNTELIDFSHPIDRWLFISFWKHSYLQKPISRTDMLNKLTVNFQHLLKYTNAHKLGAFWTMFMDRHFWLAGENFTRVDKIYMGQSIEVRLPFATPSFVTYMDQKTQKSSNMVQHLGKKKIRRQYGEHLPEYITTRMSKVGWRGPMSEWYNQKMKELFLDILPSENSEIVKWSDIRDQLIQTDHWPGKQLHWYLSTALLGKKFGLEI